MVLQAGFAVLLGRLSGQDDVVIGTPVANRRRSELEGLIGFFVNTLALRTQIDGQQTVAGLLAHVREKHWQRSVTRMHRSNRWSTQCSPSAAWITVRCSR